MDRQRRAGTVCSTMPMPSASTSATASASSMTAACPSTPAVCRPWPAPSLFTAEPLMYGVDGVVVIADRHREAPEHHHRHAAGGDGPRALASKGRRADPRRAPVLVVMTRQWRVRRSAHLRPGRSTRPTAGSRRPGERRPRRRTGRVDAHRRPRERHLVGRSRMIAYSRSVASSSGSVARACQQVRVRHEVVAGRRLAATPPNTPMRPGTRKGRQPAFPDGGQAVSGRRDAADR